MIVASSASDWVGAIGALIAAVGGVGAFAVAAWVLRPQLREYYAQQKERENRQARLVSAWPMSRQTQAEGRVLVIRNSSDQPIYRCLLWQITLSKPRGDAEIPPFTLRPSAWTTVLAPHDDFRYELRSTQGSPRPRHRPAVELIFQDDNGLSWWRDQWGRLSQLDGGQARAHVEKYNEMLGNRP
jgi:hypothetical protein